MTRQLILPSEKGPGTQKLYVRPTQQILKTFRSRIANLIEAANLTPNQRENIPALVDSEQKKVFVDCTATMEERYQYWKGRRMSDETRSFLTERRIASERWTKERLEPMVRWGMNQLPREAHTDANREYLMELAQQIARRSPGQLVGVFEGFTYQVANYFAPSVKAKLRAEILNELAIEKARKASAEQARLYKR